MSFQELIFMDDEIPGFNEMIDSAKQRGFTSKSFNGYASMKKKWIQKLSKEIKKQKIGPFEKIFLEILWIETKRNRDPDNIASFIKFILDALQKTNIIKNDGWKQIDGWKNNFEIGPKRGIRIKIYETATT